MFDGKSLLVCLFAFRCSPSRWWESMERSHVEHGNNQGLHAQQRNERRAGNTARIFTNKIVDHIKLLSGFAKPTSAPPHKASKHGFRIFMVKRRWNGNLTVNLPLGILIRKGTQGLGQRKMRKLSAAVLIDDALLAALSEKLLNLEIQLEEFFSRRVENWISFSVCSRSRMWDLP